MKNKILLFTILTFLVSACDFEIKCLDCTTETITFKTSEEKKKVNEALGVLNELFDESFEKSNIEKIIPMQDKEGKPLLKILKFKKKGYALISDIKNVDNPAVLFFSKSKFDKDHPGFKVYVEEFKATAARDTLNAILRGKKKTKKKKKRDGSKKNLPRSYGYRNPDEYCYDKWRQERGCARDCLWNKTANCSYRYYWSYPKQCGAGFCYDNFGDLKTMGSYRKETIVDWIYNKSEKDPLLKTHWSQIEPYANTINKKLKDRGRSRSDGKDFMVGCVAVAVGQIIAYHKEHTRKKSILVYSQSGIQPPGLKDKLKSILVDYYDWNKINQINLINKWNVDRVPNFRYIEIDDNIYDKETEISKFLWDIAQGVATNYDHPQGSSSSEKAAAPYFQSAGYSISGYYFWFFGPHYVPYDYDYSAVVSEIENKRPVFLSAVPLGYSDIGHAWVADGYKSVTIKRKIKRVVGDYGYYRGRQEQVSYHTQFYYSASYLHMNWGWGRSGGNGWCTYDYWYVKTDKEEYNFQSKKQMIMVKW